MIGQNGEDANGAQADPKTTSRKVRTPTESDVLLGERVAQVRSERGLKRSQMARELGVTSQAIVRWEKGYGVKRENLRRIADVYEISYEWLTSGTSASGLSAKVMERIAALPEFEATQFVEEIEMLLQLHENRANRQRKP